MFAENDFIVTTTTPLPTTKQIKKEYQVANATVQAFSPKGFKILVPDENGIQSVTILGLLNVTSKVRFASTLDYAVIDGYWTYINKDVTLNLGDVVHYWIQVAHFNGVKITRYESDVQSVFISSKPFSVLFDK